MVLIVDDCEDIGHVLGLWLKLEGIEFCCVESARAALVALAEKRPAVIILDDFMPGMDGLEFLAILRADPQYATLPVLFHTAGDRMSRCDTAEKLGITAWLRKGTTPWPVMLAHIHAQLAIEQQMVPSGSASPIVRSASLNMGFV